MAMSLQIIWLEVAFYKQWMYTYKRVYRDPRESLPTDEFTEETNPFIIYNPHAVGNGSYTGRVHNRWGFKYMSINDLCDTQINRTISI